jgi:hypothetical protein
MKETDLHLFIGRMEFADPTLLISGDEQSLLWLAEQIESRQMTTLRRSNPKFFVSEASVTLIPVDAPGRLDQQRGQYEWRIGEPQARDFVARLRVLAKSLSPAHAYLDTESSLQLVASKGEYDLQHLIRVES